MLKRNSKFFISDNTGALIGKCIDVYNKKKIGKLHDLILLSL